MSECSITHLIDYNNTSSIKGSIQNPAAAEVVETYLFK